jgi:hypothetical protein
MPLFNPEFGRLRRCTFSAPETSSCSPSEFLVVGHIHKDIDGYFSYLSKLLKQKNTYVLVDLMKAFMDSQKSAVFIPELVQKVADFKSYVQDFHHDGTNKLSGLGEMHLFKFYVEEDGEDRGWPVMRYKVLPISSLLIP